MSAMSPTGGLTELGSTLAIAIGRIGEVLPDAAARALVGLSAVTAGVRASSFPEIACSFSRLTADHFPVELSFSTAQPGTLRYTAEVAGAELAERDRLATALRVLDELASPVDHGVGALLSEMQETGVRRFGAWVGGRHDAQHDAYKLYAEVPEGLAATSRATVVDRLLGKGVVADHHCSLVRVVGYEPLRDRAEVYVRTGRSLDTLRAFLQHVAPDQAARLCAAIVALGHGRFGATPGVVYGASLAHVRSSHDHAVTVYAAAPHLIGSDASVVQEVTAWLDREGRALPAYRALTDRVRTWRAAAPAHTLVGLSLRGTALDLHLGLRPPPPSC